MIIAVSIVKGMQVVHGQDDLLLKYAWILGTQTMGKPDNMGALKNNNIFTFINTTYDISLDSQISLLPLGFSLHLLAFWFIFVSRPEGYSL